MIKKAPDTLLDAVCTHGSQMTTQDEQELSTAAARRYTAHPDSLTNAEDARLHHQACLSSIVALSAYQRLAMMIEAIEQTQTFIQSADPETDADIMELRRHISRVGELCKTCLDQDKTSPLMQQLFRLSNIMTAEWSRSIRTLERDLHLPEGIRIAQQHADPTLLYTMAITSRATAQNHQDYQQPLGIVA